VTQEVSDQLKGLDFINEDNETYYIYSFEHSGFWCKDFIGTTDNLGEAGLFNKAQAIDHVVEANKVATGLNLHEMAIPRKESDIAYKPNPCYDSMIHYI
jgi:hypothetical protein